MASANTRRRSRRLELRATPEESDLIDRAAAAAGTDRTTFVVTNAVEAARGSWRTGPCLNWTPRDLPSGRPSTGVGPGTFRGCGG